MKWPVCLVLYIFKHHGNSDKDIGIDDLSCFAPEFRFKQISPNLRDRIVEKLRDGLRVQE